MVNYIWWLGAKSRPHCIWTNQATADIASTAGFPTKILTIRHRYFSYSYFYHWVSYIFDKSAYYYHYPVLWPWDQDTNYRYHSVCENLALGSEVLNSPNFSSKSWSRDFCHEFSLLRTQFNFLITIFSENIVGLITF